MKEAGDIVIFREVLVNFLVNGMSGHGFLNRNGEDVSYRITDIMSFDRYPESTADLKIDWDVTGKVIGSEKISKLVGERKYF